MLTLLIWSIVNGFLCHFDISAVSEDIKILILVTCIASDLNLFATLSRK